MGISSRVAEVAADSRRSSTNRTYDSRLERYRHWCEQVPCDPLVATVDQVYNSFLYLFDEGLSINTIRDYRAAISAVHSRFPDNSSVGTNTVIGRAVRGAVSPD